MHKKSKSHKRVDITRVVRMRLSVLALAVFLSGFALYQQLNSAKLYGKTWRTAVLLRTQPLVLVVLPGQQEEMVRILTLPPDAYTTVPYGYGPYRLEAVWRLQELEKKAYLVTDTVGDTLGINISGTLQYPPVTDLGGGGNQDLLMRLKQLFSWTSIVLNKNPTDLNLVDRFYLTLKLNFTRSDKFDVMSLHNLAIFKKEGIPGDTTAKVIDFALLDMQIEQFLEDTEVRTEGLNAEVQNTTSTPGVGQLFARYITHLGGKVISVTTSEKSVGNCDVLANKKLRYNKIVQYLKSAFNCTVVFREHETGIDITVSVGDSFAKRWEKFLE